MPARVTAPDTRASRAPDIAASTTPPYAAPVEAAHHMLGPSYDEITTAVAANARTLHRWRAGETAPPPAYRRVTALAERTSAARGILGRGGVREADPAAAARAWLDGAGPALARLGGPARRPSGPSAGTGA